MANVPVTLSPFGTDKFYITVQFQLGRKSQLALTKEEACNSMFKLDKIESIINKLLQSLCAFLFFHSNLELVHQTEQN